MIATIFHQHWHGNGEPTANLGQDGDTYVDDLSGAIWWKDDEGWNP